MNELIEMTMDAWAEKFKPIQNPINKNASYSWGTENGCMFETFGAEYDFVKTTYNTDPLKVWTLSDVDGEIFIGEGLHFVNRLGYFITEVPCDAAVFYNIVDETTDSIDDDLDVASSVKERVDNELQVCH